MKNTAIRDILLEERYRVGSPRSKELFERACKTMPGGVKGAYFHQPYPLTMSQGDGCYVYDVEGRKFTDFANHHSTMILGHNHPAVIEVVQEQLERGIALGAAMGIETELSGEMCRRISSVNRIRFCNSGTEATLHAIRLARGFSGRTKIAKFEGGYHGSHDIVEVSVSPSLEKAGVETMPNSIPTTGGISPYATEEVVVLPYNDEVSIEKLITRHRDELACVIFDPKAGVLPLRKEFVQFVRETTREHDVLLIFDEIVGFRVGQGGLQEYYGILPDLTTYGKIIGGGFPVGAFGGRADIMDLLDNTHENTGFSQSGTFSGHPVVMAAGLATLKQLTPEVFAHLNELGNQLCHGLNDLFFRKNVSAQAINIGSVFSIHFTGEVLTNYRSLARTNKEMTHRLFLSLLEQGYFLSHGLSMNAISSPMNPVHIDGLIEAIGKIVC